MKVENIFTGLYSMDIYNATFKGFPDVLDVKQVSRILGVSNKVIYRYLNDGSILSLKVGREFRIPKLYLWQFIINNQIMSK